MTKPASGIVSYGMCGVVFNLAGMVLMMLITT